MDLVFFGIQGCGKGTQAKQLAKEFGYDIFEAGGELRKIAASKTELGKTVKSYIDVGKLVPHEIIMEVTKEAVLERPDDQQILFDGIPRDEEQMKDFDAIMQEVGREFVCVQFLLDEEVAKERIISRAEKEARADDADMEIIERRMNTFLEKTVPVIDRYRKAGKLKEVDGGGSIEQVYAGLKSVLGLI